MNTLQFDLGGGAMLALPTHTVAEKLISSLKQTTAPAPGRRKIGEYLAGQGGIYAGDIQGDDGVLYGLIISQPKDVGTAAWGPDGRLDLSDWDGLSNTNTLRDKYPAAKLASDYEADGHCDFYLPSRREMMIALANVPDLFEKSSWYWTSSLRGSYPWAVAFEDGNVSYNDRGIEFRVRPFRRFAI
ncbi:DUF1566 domain-containing protein [Alcaligenes sp. 1735tsa3]|uniref:DUF1566 domain-containing protein n=1 Tax=Alcaligenes sp. 1735tsa3 TaxID=2953809 RepID=UPI0020A7D71B|nr:DUF1566 domain-containing protein [Alcaligenes sp. 1735tsa3]USY26678.1 DUF1566 domain-containing protein [Alcaligenes sp. 1735tsa3]